MKIFWINLEINFKKALLVFNQDSKALPKGSKGFFQEIGCSANDETEAQGFIKGYLNELQWIDYQNVDVIFNRIGEISAEEVDSEIYGDIEIKDSLIADPYEQGIWYLSGKAFFTDELDDQTIDRVEIKRIDNED
ncbi:MAG: hypothetical protein ABIK15_19175 [Pseudomonadota bacterium]